MVEWIKIPIEVMCCHEDGNIEMNIEVDDSDMSLRLRGDSNSTFFGV